MKFFKKKIKGFGLAELVLAIGIFAAISSSLLLLVVDSTRALDNSRSRSKAARLVEEVNTALIMIKSESWYSLARYTDQGDLHFEFIDGIYEIAIGSGERDGFTYSFSVNPAQRDINGNTVESGGTLDPHSRLIRLNIGWYDFLGDLHSIDPVIFVNDWDTNSVVYTTYEDFLLGEHTGTMVANISGGEIRLQSMFYADWCNPSLSITSHDLPGQGIASNISTYNDTVYMGTGENASGVSFMKATVVGEPPVVTNQGTFDGYKVNDVFGANGNALLATDNNYKEVVILDVSTTPYVEVGSFNANGVSDASAVFAYGGMGFVANGTTLSVFDLSSYTGVRSLITSINVGGTITDMYVDENYIYLTLSNSTNDFVIYGYTPTLTLVGYTNLGLVNATSLYISPDTTRAYIGVATNNSPEFYILNISNKAGVYPVVSSYDTGMLSVKGVTSVDGRAILVGTGGEEYLVLDIKNESTPTRCGGLNIDTGVNALTLVKDGSNYYTYVVTKDASSEFKIIRGGPGGGGADGNGYLPSGTYVSPVFDSQSELSRYYALSLGTVIPANTFAHIQIRTSNYSNMSGAVWIGPDGTSSTYYQESGFFELPSNLSGRYLQYMVVFSSDTVNTPLIEELVINYEK